MLCTTVSKPSGHFFSSPLFKSLRTLPTINWVCIFNIILITNTLSYLLSKMPRYIVWWSWVRTARSPSHTHLCCLKKKKKVHRPFKLSNEQRGAGDAQSHKWQWVDDRFNEGQPSGDPWQDPDDHFEPWPKLKSKTSQNKNCSNIVLMNSIVKLRKTVLSRKHYNTLTFRQ